MDRRFTLALASVSLAFTCVLASNAIGQTGPDSSPVNSGASHGAPEHPATVEQVRRFVRLTKVDEAYRASWLAALDSNRAKGAPYWPESFWVDLRREMQTTDLVPVVAKTYRLYISTEMMEAVNSYLAHHTVAELAATPLGERFCSLQREADQLGRAATLELTQTTFQVVYERHRGEIKAAGAKYIQEHPNWTD